MSFLTSQARSSQSQRHFRLHGPAAPKPSPRTAPPPPHPSHSAPGRPAKPSGLRSRLPRISLTQRPSRPVPSYLPRLAEAPGTPTHPRSPPLPRPVPQGRTPTHRTPRRCRPRTTHSQASCGTAKRCGAPGLLTTARPPRSARRHLGKQARPLAASSRQRHRSAAREPRAAAARRPMRSGRTLQQPIRSFSVSAKHDEQSRNGLPRP